MPRRALARNGGATKGQRSGPECESAGRALQFRPGSVRPPMLQQSAAMPPEMKIFFELLEPDVPKLMPEPDASCNCL